MSRREVLEAAAGRSLWQDAGHRLLRNRAAMLAVVLLGVIVVMVVAGPWFSPFAYDTIDFDGQWSAPPSWAWPSPFGTDSIGLVYALDLKLKQKGDNLLIKTSDDEVHTKLLNVTRDEFLGDFSEANSYLQLPLVEVNVL